MRPLQEQLEELSKIMNEPKAPISTGSMCDQIIDCYDRGLLGTKVNIEIVRSIADQMARGYDLSDKQCQAIENIYNGYKVGSKN